MELNEMVSRLTALQKRIVAYHHAMGLISYDGQTTAPRGSGENRAETLGMLSEEIYKLTTGEETVALLDALAERAGELDEFSATGTLTIPVEQEMFMYQIVNGALKATDAVYSEENEAMELKTRMLCNYVLTPTKLDISAEVETETPSTDVDNNGGSTSQPAPGYGENSETNDYLSGGSDKVNPETGADDLVGLMASLAVLSLVGGVALSRKRK